MDYTDATVAVFSAHDDAEAAIKKLTAANFDIKKLSVVGKGYHTEERPSALQYQRLGEILGLPRRVLGRIVALVFGGLFITTPLIGPIIALGYLPVTAISAIEGAVVVGGLSALGAALYSIGISKTASSATKLPSRPMDSSSWSRHERRSGAGQGDPGNGQCLQRRQPQHYRHQQARSQRGLIQIIPA